MSATTQREEISLLLVEDNPADVELLQEILDEWDDVDFSLVHAERLEAAWRYLQQASFDIVLLDLSLPDGDGQGLIARIAEAKIDVAVVVLTGRSDEDFALEIVRSGAQDYIDKSDLDPNTVLRVVRYAIERHRLQRTLEETQQQLVAAERTRALAEIAGGAAHERAMARWCSRWRRCSPWTIPAICSKSTPPSQRATRSSWPKRPTVSEERSVSCILIEPRRPSPSWRGWG